MYNEGTVAILLAYQSGRKDRVRLDVRINSERALLQNRTSLAPLAYFTVTPPTFSLDRSWHSMKKNQATILLAYHSVHEYRIV